MRYLLLLIILTLPSYSNNNKSDQVDNSYTIMKEEYQIYSILISDMNLKGPLVIESVSSAKLKITQKTFKGKKINSLPIDLVEDFNRKNKDEYQWSKNFVLNREYLFSTDKEADDLQEQKSASVLNDTKTKKPFTKLFLSRIGFNNNKNLAVALISIGNGHRTSTVGYLFLERSNDGWRVKKSVLSKY